MAARTIILKARADKVPVVKVDKVPVVSGPAAIGPAAIGPVAIGPVVSGPVAIGPVEAHGHGAGAKLSGRILIGGHGSTISDI